MRVLLDTNVLVSAIVLGSRVPMRVYGIALSGDNVLLVPTYVLDELCRVTGLKWPSRLSSVDRFILEAPYEEVPDPGPGFDDSGLDIRDPGDLPVLRAAVAGRADAIVSGDKDFIAAHVGKIPVYTPVAFAAVFA